MPAKSVCKGSESKKDLPRAKGATEIRAPRENQQAAHMPAGIGRGTGNEAKEKASSGKLTFTKTVALEDPESDFKNTLQYEYYNSMRK